MSKVSASCHCGAVRFEVEEPEWVMDCNCSHCRLYGGLWAYYPQREVTFASPPDTFIYMWGDHMLEFHHCRTWDARRIRRLLARKMPKDRRQRPLMRARSKTHTACSENNGNDGVFWTHTESPVLPSHDAPPSE
jgi:hypothetical protein